MHQQFTMHNQQSSLLKPRTHWRLQSPFPATIVDTMAATNCRRRERRT